MVKLAKENVKGTGRKVSESINHRAAAVGTIRKIAKAKTRTTRCS
jgi:hypothetical protein